MLQKSSVISVPHILYPGEHYVAPNIAIYTILVNLNEVNSWNTRPLLSLWITPHTLTANIYHHDQAYQHSTGSVTPFHLGSSWPIRTELHYIRKHTLHILANFCDSAHRFLTIQTELVSKISDYYPVLTADGTWQLEYI